MSGMGRREFVALLGGAATAWPLAASAQQAALPVIGLLSLGSPHASAAYLSGFRQGLKDSGYVEGENVEVEYRWAEGHRDRLAALAGDLLRRQPAVIVTQTQGAQAVRRAAATIPIVFIAASDPAKLGLVDSLNRPGGNMTGVYLFTFDIEAKRLGLLRDAVPKATTIGVLVHADADYAAADGQVREVQQAALRLGVQLVVVRANPNDFEPAFATMLEQRATALLVCASPVFYSRRDQLVALVARNKLPAIFEVREYAAAGGLMSYGNNFTDSYRQLGIYAGRILKGATPADLPVVQPTKFELVINFKTAKALGLEFSPTLVALADEVP
jgi:putative tryptophan/tyrosine transport system substrate-binding protein